MIKEGRQIARFYGGIGPYFCFSVAKFRHQIQGNTICSHIVEKDLKVQFELKVFSGHGISLHTISFFFLRRKLFHQVPQQIYKSPSRLCRALEAAPLVLVVSLIVVESTETTGSYNT